MTENIYIITLNLFIDMLGEKADQKLLNKTCTYREQIEEIKGLLLQKKKPFRFEWIPFYIFDSIEQSLLNDGAYDSWNTDDPRLWDCYTMLSNLQHNIRKTWRIYLCQQ